MSEQLPQPQTSPEAQNPAAIEMQHRIDTATAQEVHDGLISHAAEIAGRTKSIESVRSQGRDISEDAFMDYMDDAVEFQATINLYKEWSGLGEDVRTGFKQYIDEQVQQSQDSEGNSTVDAQRFGDVMSASSWIDSSFDKTMRYSLAGADRGDAPKRPEREFGLASGNFIKHKLEYGALLANQEKAFQQEQAKQEQEAAKATIQQEVIVDESRKSVESLHEQTELTETIVNLGKDRTFVHANFKRGFTSTLGDMPLTEATKIYKGVTPKVKQVFGTDRISTDGLKNSNAESVMFMPVVEQEYRTETRSRVVEKKRFGKDVVQETHHKVPVPGTEYQKQVINPETGLQEPAVLFRYDFDGSAFGGQTEVAYQEYSGGRPGAALQVAVELPQSVADRLLAQIKERPNYVRDLAETLIFNNGNGQIEQKDWVERKKGESVPSIKPPYKQLQDLVPEWKIAVAVPKQGTTLAELEGMQIAKSMEVTRYKVA